MTRTAALFLLVLAATACRATAPPCEHGIAIPHWTPFPETISDEIPCQATTPTNG